MYIVWISFLSFYVGPGRKPRTCRRLVFSQRRSNHNRYHREKRNLRIKLDKRKAMVQISLRITKMRPKLKQRKLLHCMILTVVYVGHFSSRYHAHVIPPYKWGLQGYTYFPNYFLLKHKLLVPATYWVQGDKKYTGVLS